MLRLHAPARPSGAAPSAAPTILLRLLLVLLLGAGPALLVGPPAKAQPSAAIGTQPAWTHPAGGQPALTPPTQADAPLELRLRSMSPEALTPDDTLRLEVEIINRSEEPLQDLELELRRQVSRITERSTLQEWQGQTAPDADGPALRTVPVPDVPAGGSATVTVRASADGLGFSPDPSFWGARRLSVTAVEGGEPLRSLHTFTVWWPDGAAQAQQHPLRHSTLAPVWPTSPGQSLLDPEVFRTQAEEGSIAAMRGLALRDDTDWVLDPALLAPPRRLTSPPAEVGGATPSPSAAPGSEGGEGAAASDGGEDATAAAQPADAAPADFSADPTAAALSRDLIDAAGAADRTILGVSYERADVAALQAAGQDELLTELDAVTAAAWERGGIAPEAQVAVYPGARVTPETVQQAGAAGADTVIIPQGSVRADPNAGVVPSGIALIDGGSADITAITPDQSLSRELSSIHRGDDVIQARQRVLAETAVLGSENLPTMRHVVMMPRIDETTDGAGISAVLDAVDAAPWLEHRPVSSLLDAQASGRTTQNPMDENGLLFTAPALPASELRPSVLEEDGTISTQRPPQELPPLPADLLDSLDVTLTQLLEQDMALEDPAPVEAPLTLALASVSEVHRPNARRQQELAAASRANMEQIQDRILLTPASGYNLVSDSAGVPITISNRLGTPVTVTVHATVDRPIAHFGEPVTVTVPGYGQADATIPVKATANGNVELTTTLTAEGSSMPLVEPVTVPLTVNPAWENWTTLLLVSGTALLVVVGILRARRTGSDARAPAERGPEPPPDSVGAPASAHPSTSQENR